MIAVQEGQIIAGKYRLKHPLAKGGMGAVWAAEHVTLDVPVAVKFMDPQYATVDELRARFEREAKAAAQLRMPNVVQILDYGVDEGTPYIVMEFLKGEDLGARLVCEPRLSIRDTVAILTQVGKALRRAHEEGIVHRDLKPANIFLVKQDDELLVKVLDFGIAKLIRPDTIGEGTKTGAVMGSPHYMSPEQVRGLKEIDHRSDLWSVGVIAYRMLTGRLPFPGTQMGDVFLKICTERPIPPTQLVEDLDIRVDALIRKALAVKPAERFQSAKELMDALAALTVAMGPEVITLPRPPVADVDVIEAKTSPYKPAPTPVKVAPPSEPIPALENVKTEPLTPPLGVMARPTPPVDELATNAPVTQPIVRDERREEALTTSPQVSKKRPFGLVIGGIAVLSLVVIVGLYATSRPMASIETSVDSPAPKATTQAAAPKTTNALEVVPVSDAHAPASQASAALLASATPQPKPMTSEQGNKSEKSSRNSGVKPASTITTKSANSPAAVPTQNQVNSTLGY